MGGEASNDAKSLECSQCCWAASGGARGAKAEIHLAAESAVRRLQTTAYVFGPTQSSTMRASKTIKPVLSNSWIFDP